MNHALFESVPGFDEPIAVLKHCHDKIRKQIQTMQKLLTYLPEHGPSLTAQQAATAVLHYFTKAAHHHHQDEEQDLMPMLLECASGDDAALLRDAVPKILKEHKQMEAAWQVLELQLSAIAAGESGDLSALDVDNFAELYASHMITEETYLAPMAKRLFSPERMARLGAAMQKRRTPPDAALPAGGPTPVLADLRQDYCQASMSEGDVAADPVTQFSKWFDEAVKAEVRAVNAMSVATVAADGRPSSRIVLIKEFDGRGFTFFTNYSSRKGHDLQHNQYAAMLFFWSELERQVRIEGRIERISASESDAYFNSRPLASRLSAIASSQSAPVADRAAMEVRLAEVHGEFGDQPPRPEHWGGYRLVPDHVEFWQGRRSRFHDRILFSLQADGGWQKQRLQP
jgi:pyridoxamine 5'-phosphate oxidase